MYNEITLQRDHLTLRGYLETPKNKITYPLVILMHGILDSCKFPMLEALRESLVAAGYAVMAFSFDGHGDSDGSFLNMTIEEEYKDAAAILNYARSMNTVTRISVIGHSLGGLTASLLAANHPVNDLILLAPAGSLPDDIRNGHMLDAKFDPFNLPSHIIIFGEDPVGRKFLSEAMRHDIYREAAGYRNGHILVIWGTKDTLVTEDSCLRYLDVYRKKEYGHQVEYVKIPGAIHEFSNHHKEVCDTVLDFLKD